MRRLLKFIHTASSAALTGAAVALIVLLIAAPKTPDTPGHAMAVGAAAKIATWIIAPSMLVAVISGLMAMIPTPAYQNAGWVWLKAGSGIVVLQATLHVIGPLQAMAKASAPKLAHPAAHSDVTQFAQSEVNTLWMLVALCVANIALGVWRPRIVRRPD